MENLPSSSNNEEQGGNYLSRLQGWPLVTYIDGFASQTILAPFRQVISRSDEGSTWARNKYGDTDLDDTSLDVLVVEELRENEEFLAQELVGEVHRGVHDTRAVRADRVGDVPDVDRVQVLVVGRPFHKNLQHSDKKRHTKYVSMWTVVRYLRNLPFCTHLVVEVIQIAGNKHVDITHDFQHVQALSTAKQT